MAKIAVVQDVPVWLDRTATLARCAEIAARAAKEGARLAVFPESFISGYPDWIWRLRPWPDAKIAAELHQKLVESAVDLSRGDLDPLLQAARENQIAIVSGINELHPQTRGSLYNTVVTIGADGVLLNAHRKLVPTHPERMVWAPGDGAGLTVVETPAGRVGALICWENYMPLARATLYAQGLDLYLAPTWDHGEGWLASMQHIAREARCWVAAPAICLQAREMPEALPGRAQLYPDPEEWVHPGESVVVDPMGKIAAGPLRRERGILYAECDLARVQQARRTLDVAGHYARPDVFDLRVSTFDSKPAPGGPR